MSVNTFGAKVKAIGKVVVGALGFEAAALVEYSGLVPPQWRGYAAGFVAVCTLLGIYHAPYAPLGRKGAAAGKLGGKTGHTKKVGWAHVPIVPSVKPPKE